MDFVAPFAVESVSFDLDFGEFFPADLSTFFINLRIQPGMHFQSGGGRRGADETDNDLQSFQRDTLPVASDVTKQTVLDLIPLTRSRRIMTDLDDQSGFVCKLLKFCQPQPCARTVAATTVGSNQQSSRGFVAFVSQSLPPAPNRGNCKFGGVVSDPDRDTRIVVPNIIHSVGNRLAQRLVRKVVCLYFDRLARATICFPGILQLSKRFFLLRIDGNGRITAAC